MNFEFVKHCSVLQSVAVAGLLLLAMAIGCQYIGVKVIPPDTPIERQFDITHSIIAGTGLTPPRFESIIDGIKARGVETGTSFLQDVVSLGINRELYPKHPYISSLLAVPFVLVFGNFGFWLMQYCMSLILVFSTVVVVQRFTSKNVALPTALACVFGTQLIYGMDTFLFSYDFHAAAVLMAGLALVSSYPFCAGVLIGSLVHFRVSNVLLVPFCLFVFPLNKQSSRMFFGCTVMLCLFGLSNWIMYGNPFTLPYQRIPIVTSTGSLVITPHETGFNLMVFASDWYQKLFSFPKGWLLTNPVLLALPLLLPYLFAHKHARSLGVLVCALMVYASYIFSYEYWAATFIGNRFLLPATFIGLVVAVALVDRVLSLYTRRHWKYP